MTAEDTTTQQPTHSGDKTQEDSWRNTIGRTNEHQKSDDWRARNITQLKAVTQVAQVTHITNGVRTLDYSREMQAYMHKGSWVIISAVLGTKGQYSGWV